MDKHTDTIKLTLSAAVGYMLGGWDSMLQLLITVMAVDYTTGLAVAGIFKKSQKTENGGIQTVTGFKGLVRKVCILLLVLVVTRLEHTLGDTVFCRNTVIVFFVVNETLSVLENMGLMGVKYPDRLKTALEVLNKNNNNNATRK
ncbi:MAG: phage holin family protein [Oscillospiraceae bacterium]|nr:phage holin family protein [Oscillospiraceae bacterium]